MFTGITNWSAQPRWYKPEEHWPEWQCWMQRMVHTIAPVYDCVDVFGASCRVADTWRDAGYQAISYDVKIDRAHDLVSANGFRTLMTMGMMFLGGPCCFCQNMRVFFLKQGKPRLFGLNCRGFASCWGLKAPAFWYVLRHVHYSPLHAHPCTSAPILMLKEIKHGSRSAWPNAYGRTLLLVLH